MQQAVMIAEVEAQDTARRVLEVARAVALELHPQRRSRLRVTLDASLDRDLGLDSLGRVELLLRMEREFRVRLPEGLLAEAATPRDLVAAVLQGSPTAERGAEASEDLSLGPVAAAPDDASTLVEALEWHANHHPERTHVVLEGSAGGDLTVSYAALCRGARAVAAGLRSRGIVPGDSVSIMLPTGLELLESFFGVLYAGAVPVPIYPPFRPAQLEDHLRRQAGILANAQARLLVAPAEARAVSALLRAQVPRLEVESPEALAASGDNGAPAHAAGARDLALIQYTSGSTGEPKGVALSHANLLANIRAMGRALEVDARDVFVSWLPLYHDMGLIGAWLGSLYFAVPAAILSPLRFLARPEAWLWAIHRRRATLSAAPNFAYELCVRKLVDADLAGLDLSSWRIAVNGAEPVSPETLRRFAERFERFGFRREALMPVYGLAECSVGLAFPPTGRGPWIDRAEREGLARHGEARPARADDASALEFPSCGLPLPGHQIRIVDERGREVAERHQGRLQFRGPSATRGYFRNQERTRLLFDAGWLESGDLAYIANGEVFLTGRTKDLIIRAGRNIYPHEVEEAVGALDGVRKGCVAVFGSFDPRAQTERIVVLAETRESEPAAREAIVAKIEQVTTLLLDGPPDDVVLAPPHTVLKTSSGKIRRSACRELYEQGRLAQHPRALWSQALRLALSGVAERVRAAHRFAAETAYATWWWCALVIIAIVLWPLSLVAPSRSRAWVLLRAGARAFLWLTGTPLSVAGSERLPHERGVVLVANHASYLDGLVLIAVLRRPVCFVAKHELAEQRVAGPFLRRIGALFVERTDLERGIQDARVALDAASLGEPLLFFPEGTFQRGPGLLPFHVGAFTVAAAAGVPVIPVAVRGTRSILRGDQWFPRRGAISLEIGPSLEPKSADWTSAIELRDAARVWLLAHCGEPDLEEDISPSG